MALGDFIKKAKDTAADKIRDAKLDEKFADAKEKFGESLDNAKQQMADHKAASKEAAAPVEGSLVRYTVVYLGGFPKKPPKKTSPTAFGMNITETAFVFKPELPAKEWFGDELFTIPFDKVIKFEIVKRQVSTTEAMLSGSGSTKDLEQENNIQITYVDDGEELMTRVEMLTGVTVYGQAEKCRELVDFLREQKIYSKLNKDKAAAPATTIDVTEQLMKLNGLKEAGILSEEEFAAKKAELLSKM